MVDFTIIATTLGASAITGSVAYFAARKDFLRVEEERRETHRTVRQRAYHELLDAVFRFPLMAKGYSAADADEFCAWLEEFQSRMHAVELVATEHVLIRAERLDGLILRALPKMEEVGADRYPTALRAQYGPLDEPVRDAYLHMLGAMREDVGVTTKTAEAQGTQGVR